MRVTINGSIETFQENTLSVKDALAKMKYSFPLIIVKINGRLVERGAYANETISDGDNVEFYHLVSGG